MKRLIIKHQFHFSFTTSVQWCSSVIKNWRDFAHELLVCILVVVYACVASLFLLLLERTGRLIISFAAPATVRTTII